MPAWSKRRYAGSFHQENFVFYLQFGSKVDGSFIKLSENLKKFGVILVPIEGTEIANVLTGPKQTLVILIDNISKARKFNKLRDFCLDKIIANNSMDIFLCSSFGTPPRWGHFQRNYRLQVVNLPVKYLDVADKITRFYFDRLLGKRLWPGRRRGYLPLER